MSTPQTTLTPKKYKGDSAHPLEPTDPCCIPALGEFMGYAPCEVLPLA